MTRTWAWQRGVAASCAAYFNAREVGCWWGVLRVSLAHVSNLDHGVESNPWIMSSGSSVA
eukprot:scaffold76015_cov26-Phaeocystis_antarctica.AAC.1